MNRWWWLMVTLAAGPLRANDAQAFEHLLLAQQCIERDDLAGARREFIIARGLADRNYLRLECLARSAGLKERNGAARASDIGLLMTYFRTTPPQWLSDEARKIVTETHAAQSASGLFDHLPAGPGIRSTEFREGRAGSGFVGKRYGLILELPGIPPPEVLDSDIPERMAEIQRLDDDRLGDPARRVALGGGRWALVDPRHDRHDTPDEVRATWRFDRCLVGYTLEPLFAEKDERGRLWWKPIRPWYQDQPSIWQLRFRLFYPSEEAGASRDYGELAQQLMDVLLRTVWVGNECLGRQAYTADGRHAVLNVYLTENPAEGRDDAGAERTTNGIYLYQAAAERQPDEWVREAVHEYAHAILPQLGRYDAATAYGESWLEGPLGERLLLRCLGPILADQPRGELLELLEFVRVRKSIDEYLKQAWDPLVRQFLEAGPKAPARSDLGAAGADWAVGFGCWMAETHQAGLVRDFWRTIVGVAQLNGTTMMKHYLDTVREPEQWEFGCSRPAVVDPDKPPRTVARGLELRDGVAVEYHVFIPHGHWYLRVLSAAPSQLTLQIDGAQEWLSNSGDRIGNAKVIAVEGRDDWARIRIGGFGANPIVLRALSFTRQR